jgi:hypothetical protein
MTATGDAPVRGHAVRIDVGERFPVVRAHRVRGGKIVLPGDVDGRWAVILFYRGNWCYYCIEFEVGYGLDPLDIEKSVGAYLGKDDAFVQATGFVLRPKGRTVLAVYSSGAVGRLVAKDVLGLIHHARKQE